MQADYTSRLDAIVRALNRPSIPGWAIALISTGFGVVGAFIGLWLADFYKRYKLRRVLYRGLIGMFSLVDDIALQKFIENDHDRIEWQKQEITRHLKFDSQTYLKANQDLYISLAEYSTAEALYAHFHTIIDTWYLFPVNTARAVRLFSHAVKEGWLSRYWIRVFLSHTAYKRIMERVDEYWEVEQALTRNSDDTEPTAPRHST